MIKITGDSHGLVDRFLTHIDPFLSDNDILIVTGDFGFWDFGVRNRCEPFLDLISTRKYLLLFCEGNHDDFDVLSSCKEQKFCGGKVHVIRHNILHLMRSSIFTIEGRKFFVFGGGESIDRYRREVGKSWWPQEIPSDYEYENAERNLNANGRKVDYIISHTGPANTVEYLSRLNIGIRNNIDKERRLQEYLEYISTSVSYKRHFFGHFHVDKELWKNQIVLLNSIRECDTGKIIHSW